MNAGLARGLSHYRSDRLSPADWVTLARATLAVGVAALVADSFDQAVPVTLLVSLAVVALGLDAVDGWVARRTRTTATLGAHFDAEVDAFLILVLSVYVARSAGAWVLAIGAARYAFLAAGWLLPWMREPLPPRYLAQGRRCDARDRADHCRRGRPAAGSDPGHPRRGARPACRVVRPRRVVAVEHSARHPRSRSGGREPHCRSCSPHSAPPETRRMRTSIGVALTIARPTARLVRPRRSGPSASSHARRVPEGPARGSRPDRRGPRPTSHRSTHLGRHRRTGSRPGGHPEDPRHGVLRGLRSAVRPLSRLELRRDRQRDAARLDRSRRTRIWSSPAWRCSSSPYSSS